MPTRPRTFAPAGLRTGAKARTGARPSSNARGYSHRWRRAARRYLEGHPLCVRCLAVGRCTPASDVDHIQPHRGDLRLFWNEDNWQGLCHRCHARKTRLEDMPGDRRRRRLAGPRPEQ